MGLSEMLGHGLFGQMPEWKEFDQMMAEQRQAKEQEKQAAMERQGEAYLASLNASSSYKTEIQCEAMRMVDLEEACEEERRLRQARRALAAEKQAQAETGITPKIDLEAERTEMSQNKMAVWTSCDRRATYEWIRRHADFNGARPEINSLRRKILESYGLGDLEPVYSKQHPTLQVYLPPEEEAALFPEQHAGAAEEQGAPAPKA